ncbi:MAG: alpha/beta hydrolase family protein, partial [bacterium]
MTSKKLPVALGSAVLLACLFTSTLAGAVDFTCPTDDSPTPWRKTRIYFDPPRSEWSSLSGFLCRTDSAGNCADIKLRGFLYLPDGNVADSRKDMPLVIFNHGSGWAAPDPCEMAAYFNRHGYALFLPHRRGHGGSTGLNDFDYMDLCNGICDPVTAHLRLLGYLEDQNFEVRKAIDFMRGLRNSAGERIIDPEKIAIVGHSFGGMLALFNNVKLSAPKVVIPIAPASESWQAFDREDGT